MHAPAHLDRLTALLHGVSPQSQLQPSQAGQQVAEYPAQQDTMLRVHVLDAPIQVAARGAGTVIERSSFWICRADIAHRLMAHGGNDLAQVVSINVHLSGPIAPILLAEFSQPRQLALDGKDTLLANVLALIRSETAALRCGQPALLAHAADMLFISLLRHLVAQPQAHSGLFVGLSDSRIATALVAMHEAPELPWTLETLAQRVGMSRTAFAVGFKRSLNRTPGKYLSGLRICIAKREVATGSGLKAAARASGYANMSALSRALGKHQALSDAFS